VTGAIFVSGELAADGESGAVLNEVISPPRTTVAVAWFDGRLSTVVGRDDHDIDDGQRLGVFALSGTGLRRRAFTSKDGNFAHGDCLENRAFHPWSPHWQ
jgi:hypothetical protein